MGKKRSATYALHLCWRDPQLALKSVEFVRLLRGRVGQTIAQAAARDVLRERGLMHELFAYPFATAFMATILPVASAGRKFQYRCTSPLLTKPL